VFAISRIAELLAPRLLWRRRARKWLRDEAERELTLIPFLCHPAKTSIDVGAFMGVYVIHMLGYSHDCVAFEPRTAAAQELRRVFRRASVRIEQCALSEDDGEATFREPLCDAGRSTLADSNPLEGMGDVNTQSVSTRRLDSYGFANVGFIKIDVEGHELAVLKGALSTIERNHPALLIEIEERHRPGGLAAVRDLLEPHGYRGSFLDGKSLIPISQLPPESQDPARAGSIGYINNFLFLRPEHQARFVNGMSARGK